MLVQTLIYLGYLTHPLLALRMFQLKNLSVRPVKVICDVRYLFIEPLYGVAPDPPRLLISISNCSPQCGHCVCMRECPFSLM